MTAFTRIDLSQLPAPKVIEALDYETIFSALLTDFRTRYPQFSAEVESEPVIKQLQTAAYREMLIRQRVNDAAAATLLAFATGSDLDARAADFEVQRKQLTPGDPNASPPVDPTYESDDELRVRAQLAFESTSTAGPVGAYVARALSAHADVFDVSVRGPAIEAEAGQVRVTVMSRVGDGVPSAPVLSAVAAALNAENVRPLTDEVLIAPVTRVPFVVTATLVYLPGPSPEVVRSAAQDALQRYLLATCRLGRTVTLSGLYAALHQPGVARVDLTSPPDNVAAALHEAPHCTAITLTDGGTSG